jgi:hypothetical protein
LLPFNLLQLDHYNNNEFGWNFRMFSLGFINNAGIGLMIVYTSNLSATFDRNLQFAMFAVFLQAVPILARILNSVYFI